MYRMSFGLLAVLLLISVGAAQDNQATINATATVLAPIQVNDVQGLDFGDVLPGVTYTVEPGNADAGRFEITGVGDQEVSLSFTLPSELTGPGDPISLVFGAGSASHSTNSDYTTGSVLFDPASGADTDLSAGGELFVAIGGEITPALNQTAGLYTSDITLTVSYTGN